MICPIMCIIFPISLKYVRLYFQIVRLYFRLYVWMSAYISDYVHNMSDHFEIVPIISRQPSPMFDHISDDVADCRLFLFRLCASYFRPFWKIYDCFPTIFVDFRYISDYRSVVDYFMIMFELLIRLQLFPQISDRISVYFQSFPIRVSTISNYVRWYFCLFPMVGSGLGLDPGWQCLKF